MSSIDELQKRVDLVQANVTQAQVKLREQGAKMHAVEQRLAEHDARLTHIGGIVESIQTDLSDHMHAVAAQLKDMGDTLEANRLVLDRVLKDGIEHRQNIEQYLPKLQRISDQNEMMIHFFEAMKLVGK